MQINDKQYYIFLRSTRERIPCTKEEFDAYYHDIDLFRQRQQYRKQCVCPQRKRLECDMDCQTCPFNRSDDLSLDKPLETAEGDEVSLLDSIPDESPLISELIANTDELGRLFRRLNEIMPEAVEIGILRQAGLSDGDIAARIGTPRTTLLSRLKKAGKILKEEFPEYF